MGLNACICLRNLDELSAETALNGDGEIEGFNFPNTNNQNISSTDYSSKLKGAGRMSHLMKVNTIDSGILKNTAFYNLKAASAALKIQSFFRGSTFRKKLEKAKENSSNNKNNDGKNEIKKVSDENKNKNDNKNQEIVNNINDNNSNDEKERDKPKAKILVIYQKKKKLIIIKVIKKIF